MADIATTDLSNIDMSKLSKKQQKALMSIMKAKETCPGAVKLAPKTLKKLMTSIDEKDHRAVYYRAEIGGDGRSHSAFYSPCTRPCKDGDNMCSKHSGSDKAVLFDSLTGLKEITSADDPVFSGKVAPVEEAIVISLLVNPTLVQKFRDALSQFGIVPNEGSKPSDLVIPPGPAEAAEAAATSTEDDDDDDEGEELISIKTNKGVSLGYDPSTREVLTLEGDVLGKLTPIGHKNPPITYEGSGYIVAIDFEHDDEDYVRCAISGNLYQLKDAVYEKVGTVKTAKSGRETVHLLA